MEWKEGRLAARRQGGQYGKRGENVGRGPNAESGHLILHTVGMVPKFRLEGGVVMGHDSCSQADPFAVRTFMRKPKGDPLLFCLTGQVIEEFYNIFGPELKAVTGDPKRIDDVLCRVDSLVTPMETLTFDPFNIQSAQYWKYVIDDFKIEVLASNTSIGLIWDMDATLPRVEFVGLLNYA